MGLDISAYRKLEVIENPVFDEDGSLVNWESEFQPGASMEWSEEHFPGRGEGVDPNKVYKFAEEYSFRAGGYGSYNWWRSQLESFKGDKAFQELINFADNEGVIGPIVSKKLAKDFIENEEEAIAFSKTLKDNADYWLESYRNWKKAFEVASDNGAVNFR